MGEQNNYSSPFGIWKISRTLILTISFVVQDPVKKKVHSWINTKQLNELHKKNRFLRLFSSRAPATHAPPRRREPTILGPLFNQQVPSRALLPG
jgi:hypothetical protein